MKNQRPYRKFELQQDKINFLEKSSPRFRRIYSEYRTMSDELWDLECADGFPIPDAFLDSVRLQTDFLEDEISDWLLQQDTDGEEPQ